MENGALVRYDNEIDNDVANFSRGLKGYLTFLGLPCDNILVNIEQRGIVIANMPFILNNIPSNKSELYYISKFIASCSAGLFNAALNYLWNETIVNLRQKVILFDLNYFFNALGKDAFHSEEDLNRIEDWELIKGCLEVGILSEIGFKHLNYIRDMRNFASAAHPNNNELDGLQISSWLQTCIKEVLSKDPSSYTLAIKKLLPSIRNETLTEVDSKPIIANIEHLPQDLANSLLMVLFGMYTDEQVNANVRNNINYLSKSTWLRSDIKRKNNIALKYASFSSNGQIRKKELAKEFLIYVDGLGYLTDDQRSLELRDCIEALLTAHNNPNNFYNEEPNAKIIFNYVHGNENIPSSVRSLYVNVIVMCKLGNYYGVSRSAVPYYNKMIDMFGDEEIKEFLALLKDTEFRVLLDNHVNPSVKPNEYKIIADKLIGKTSNEVLKQALETVKQSSNSELKNRRAYLNIKNLIN